MERKFNFLLPLFSVSGSLHCSVLYGCTLVLFAILLPSFLYVASIGHMSPLTDLSPWQVTALAVFDGFVTVMLQVLGIIFVFVFFNSANEQ